MRYADSTGLIPDSSTLAYQDLVPTPHCTLDVSMSPSKIKRIEHQMEVLGKAAQAIMHQKQKGFVIERPNVEKFYIT
jgi:hypothetical protein